MSFLNVICSNRAVGPGETALLLLIFTRFNLAAHMKAHLFFCVAYHPQHSRLMNRQINECFQPFLSFVEKSFFFVFFWAFWVILGNTSLLHITCRPTSFTAEREHGGVLTPNNSDRFLSPQPHFGSPHNVPSLLSVPAIDDHDGPFFCSHHSVW